MAQPCQHGLGNDPNQHRNQGGHGIPGEALPYEFGGIGAGRRDALRAKGKDGWVIYRRDNTPEGLAKLAAALEKSTFSVPEQQVAKKLLR
mgnify:CR=1 FL=1